MERVENLINSQISIANRGYNFSIRLHDIVKNEILYIQILITFYNKHKKY